MCYKRSLWVASSLVLWCVGSALAEPAPGGGLQPPWPTPSGEGVSVGFENGLWAGHYASGVRIRLPIDPHWAVLVRPIMVHGIDLEPYRLDLLGRVELSGGSAVYFNVLRVYGSGGAHLGTQLSGTGKRTLVVGLGGQVGLEAFFTPRASVYLEIGGSGDNNGGFTAGGTAVGGVMLYL